jgi:acetyl esterase/lipase
MPLSTRSKRRKIETRQVLHAISVGPAGFEMPFSVRFYWHRRQLHCRVLLHPLMKTPVVMAVTCLIASPLFAQAPSGGSSAESPRQAAPAKKASAQKPEAYSTSVPKPTFSAVPYGEHERQILDFWQADSSGPAPVAFVIHGGGWVGGSKERVDRFVDVNALLKAGVSVVAINYRLIRRDSSADTTPPVKAPLHDAARALQFVRSKAAEWNIDKSRIGAAGGSAGACSSLWLAFHEDLSAPNSEDPVARESTRLSCAAVTGPQTTLDPQQMQEWTPNSTYGGHAFGLGSFQEFLAAREKILPLIAEYSPYALVSSDDPAVYMIFNAAPAIGQPQKDPTHTANFGVKLAEHCMTKNVSAEVVYPSAPDVKHPTPTDFLIARLKPVSK